MTTSGRSGVGVLAFGAAACAVCCAGPLLALLGGVAVAGLAGSAVIGPIALLATIAAVLTFIVMRRRRSRCAPTVDAISVPAPTSRTPQTAERR